MRCVKGDCWQCCFLVEFGVLGILAVLQKLFRHKGAERVLGQVGSWQRFMSVMRVFRRPSWYDPCLVPSESLLCFQKMEKLITSSHYCPICQTFEGKKRIKPSSINCLEFSHSLPYRSACSVCIELSIFYPFLWWQLFLHLSPCRESAAMCSIKNYF